MKKYLIDKKVRLTSFIEKQLEIYRKDFEGFNHWGNDSFSRIPEFISRGKMVRGALVYLSYEAFGGTDLSKADSLAAAIELLHAGFLIHDDIMDNDELRRGKPSIHIALKEKFDDSYTDTEKTAENIAICLGNICYFTAFDLISDIKINRMFNREATITGLGQMDDLFLSSAKTIPEYETILNIYKLKTARYTFSLPLKTGAIAAGANENTLELLNEIGINIGTLFQMRDDELNFYGDTSKTGKPAGSDIREGKKTLIYSILLNCASDKDIDFIRSSLGNADLDHNDVLKLRDISRSSGAMKKHELMAKEFHKLATEGILKLNVDNESREILENILNYSYKRSF